MKNLFFYLAGGSAQGGMIGAMLWWIASGMGGVPKLLPGPLSTIYAWVATGVVGGLLVGTMVYIRRFRHAEQVAGLAHDWNFHYEARTGLEQIAPYRDLQLFASDRFREVTNLMRATTDDAKVELLDYEYVCRGTEADSFFRQTVALFPDCTHQLPAFELTPRRLAHKLVYQFTGLEGISFEPGESMSAADREVIETFRSTYFLSPPTNAVTQMLREHRGRAVPPHALAALDAPIRSVFCLKLLTFFAKHPGWSVESNGRHLAAWRTDHVVPAADRHEFLRDAREVQQAILSAQDSPAVGVIPGALKVDPRRAVFGLAAGMIGAVAGFSLGSLVGVGVIATVLSIAAVPPVPVLVLLFLAGPVIGAVVGAAIGRWWRRRSLSRGSHG